MASRRDFATLRIVSATKRKAERDGEDVLFELSGGDDYFENAIRTIKNSGQATLICLTITTILLVVFFIIMVLSPGKNPNTYLDSNINSFWNIIFPYIVFGLPNIFFAYKVKSLLITPSAMLVFTIISLILNLFCFLYISPIVALIFNIIALTKYSAYKEWFYSIDVNYYREKAHDDKIKRQ